MDFIQDQPGLSNLQVSFFRKKTVINSLSLSEFFDKNFSLNLINFKSLDIVERDNQKGKVLNSVFNFHSYGKALLIDIVNKNKLINFHKPLVYIIITIEEAISAITL